jgi:hypothetical protein
METVPVGGRRTAASTHNRIYLQRPPHSDVVGPPPGELLSETNDNSVALLPACGTARVLLAGDAEARKSTWRAPRTPGH